MPVLKVGDAIIKPTMEVRNLGACFDRCGWMAPFVSRTVQTWYAHMDSMCCIRAYLSTEACAVAVHVLVLSHVSGLQYANSMLVGTSKWMLQKLQVVQNNAARLVCLLSKCSHFSPVLKHLHWLPVWQEIKYELACLADKALNCVDALACLVFKWQQTSRRLHLQSSGWHPVVPSAKNHLETGHLTWLPQGCGTVCQALM